jgi:hypothetical protein
MTTPQKTPQADCSDDWLENTLFTLEANRDSPPAVYENELNRVKQAINAKITELLVEARIDENQRRLDKIHEWRNRKPVPGELTTSVFGSASGAMEVSGFEHSFEDRIAALKLQASQPINVEVESYEIS